MSSRLRWCACFLAWASSWLVLKSSTDMRRPRSAMRSKAVLPAILVAAQSKLAGVNSSREPGPAPPRSVHAGAPLAVSISTRRCRLQERVTYLLEHDLFRKPEATPDQVRGRLFRDHALIPRLEF